jgi:hypothetical protein
VPWTRPAKDLHSGANGYARQHRGSAPSGDASGRCRRVRPPRSSRGTTTMPRSRCRRGGTGGDYRYLYGGSAGSVRNTPTTRTSPERVDQRQRPRIHVGRPNRQRKDRLARSPRPGGQRASSISVSARDARWAGNTAASISSSIGRRITSCAAIVNSGVTGVAARDAEPGDESVGVGTDVSEVLSVEIRAAAIRVVRAARRPPSTAHLRQWRVHRVKLPTAADCQPAPDRSTDHRADLGRPTGD